MELASANTLSRGWTTRLMWSAAWWFSMPYLTQSFSSIGNSPPALDLVRSSFSSSFLLLFFHRRRLPDLSFPQKKRHPGTPLLVHRRGPQRILRHRRQPLPQRIHIEPRVLAACGFVVRTLLRQSRAH